MGCENLYNWVSSPYYEWVDVPQAEWGECIGDTLYQVWLDDVYAYAVTDFGFKVLDIETSNIVSYIDIDSGFTSIWGSTDLIYLATPNNGIKYIEKITISGSIFSPYNGDDIGEVNEIYKGHHYAALAPLINKDFFKNYIEPCINDYFYRNFTTRSNFVVALNKKYKKYWGKEYKYTNEAHNQQAGLINRLVDVALIEEDRHVITPYVNRQQHIGYGFSLNRPGGALPGIFFDERLRNLREIIKSAEKMYSMTAAKQYNDYKIFSNKLKEWDGTLRLNR